MLSCLVVDDELPAINILKKYISDTPYLELKASTTDVMEAIDILKKEHIDLVFLDIQMPKLTGLQFIDLFGGKLNVILTTAYSEYALESYDKNVIDYLKKPIPFERFLKATEKALNLVNKATISHSQASTPENTNTSPEASNTVDEFFFVKTEHKGKLRKINLNEITYIEGLKNYVSIYLDKRERVVTYIGIGELEEKLSAKDFARVHRSYIVPVRNIIAIDGNEIILKDAPRIPTAGKFKESFLMGFRKNLLQFKDSDFADNSD